MVYYLPEGNTLTEYGVELGAVLCMASDVKDGVEIRVHEVHIALALISAEYGGCEARYLAVVFLCLLAAYGMVGVTALFGSVCGKLVYVEHTGKAVAPYYRQIVLCISFVCALRAYRIGLTAVKSFECVYIACECVVFALFVFALCKVLYVKVVCYLVRTAAYRVRNYLVAEALCACNKALERGIAAVARIARILLGEASVVSRGPPTDEAYLRLVDAVFLQLVYHSFKHLYGAGDVQGRLCCGCLVAYGGGNGLPTHAHSYLHRLGGFSQRLALEHSFLQRTAALNLHLILAVFVCHLHVACVRHTVEVYGDILLGLVSLKLEQGGYAVYSALGLYAEVCVCRVSVNSYEHTALILAKSAYGRCGKPGKEACILSGGKIGGNKAAAEVGGVKEVALLARLGLKKLRFHDDRVQICVFQHSFRNAEAKYVSEILKGKGKRV